MPPPQNNNNRVHHEAFHPVWGQLLKTGYQNSRYGHQIDRFACLYTSHVSNMAFYSPDTAYSGKGDSMAHEVSDCQSVSLGGTGPAGGSSGLNWLLCQRVHS